MRELLIFDFDKTLILNDSIVELSYLLIGDGYLKPEFWDKSNLSSINLSCFSLRAKGVILKIWNSFSKQEKRDLLLRLRSRIEWNDALVSYLREQSGKYDILVSSAGFSFVIVDLLKSRGIDIDYLHCGNSTKEGIESFKNNSGVYKLLSLNKLLEERSYTVRYAFSDSIHDLPILLAAKRGFIVTEGYGFKDNWSKNFGIDNWKCLTNL